MPPTNRTSRSWSLPPTSATVAGIAIAIVLLLLLLLTLTSVLYCVYLRRRHPTPAPVADNRIEATDWARKGSNVLWSMYPDDEDLKSQFKFDNVGRLFSVGSVSSTRARKSSEVAPCEIQRRRSEVDGRRAGFEKVDLEKQGSGGGVGARRASMSVSVSVSAKAPRESLSLVEMLSRPFVGRQGSVAD